MSTPETAPRKTLAQRLFFKPGDRVFVLAGQGHPADLLMPLPEGTMATPAPDGADAALVFADDAEALEALLAGPIAALVTARAVWIAYPKGGRSDINRDRIWARVGELGWRLNGNIAVDETWSAVRVAFA